MGIINQEMSATLAEALGGGAFRPLRARSTCGFQISARAEIA
jgi:hypothetical protein